MSLQGLPDFFQPLTTSDNCIYYPYENAGSFAVLPRSLEVALRTDGYADFLLELVRGETPALTPYGLLNLRLQPQYEMEAALTTLRDRYPESRVEPAVFSTGYLRLLPIGDGVDFPADIQSPMPLVWNGLGNVRFSLRLSSDSAMLLKNALQQETFLWTAWAEMEMAGVAPRLPLWVRFNPARLLRVLNSLGDSERRIARVDLENFFRQEVHLLPLEMIGEVQDTVTFAETMTDWIRTHFGEFVPAPEQLGNAYLQLPKPEQVGDGISEWNLAQPLQTARPVVLQLNPLEAARAAVQQFGLDALVRNTVVPALPSGMLPISLLANLPRNRPGVEAVGVTLRAAPFRPFRPQAIVQTIEFKPPEDTASALFRLSPIEPPKYTATPYALLSDSQGIRKLEGTEKSCQGNLLYLNPSDFPLAFFTVEADTPLLKLTTLKGICHWQEAGIPLQRTFELSQQQPSVALAFSKGTQDATIDISAHSLQTNQIINFGTFPAKNLKLGLYSFREYGPHQVKINCIFNDSLPLFAIALLPEDRPETSEEISVLSFTPQQPSKTWSYLARSPFQSGYRYRIYSPLSQTVSEWSTIQSPFEPLVIQAIASSAVETS
ncbi:hypothetical protein H6F88_08455 [Oculatella sp. FACHB-28]|uniref:hypothetical protein n=1 Tax=Oculatella sp. FACHB-28 TaxID=2692845 RepID=UPI001688650C|nr:hypothetical protein [Oculatella sp. FACHB-28]MBD2056046.1 hypothetical protein [Oculatella sp. FACHB-28]